MSDDLEEIKQTLSDLIDESAETKKILSKLGLQVDERRASYAKFLLQKRSVQKKIYWPLVKPYYWFVEHCVEDFDMERYTADKLIVAGIVGVIGSLGVEYWADQMNKTELGEIRATSSAFAINSGTYSTVTGKGPYVFMANGLSLSIQKDGFNGSGYDDAGGSGSLFNYTILAEDGREMNLSFVEPAIVNQFKHLKPLKSSDTTMEEYAVLLKQLPVKECAWSISSTYNEYSAIEADLAAGKTITLAQHWEGTGSYYATKHIVNTYFNDYQDQIDFVEVQGTDEMLKLSESGTLDLAIFTEAAGSFNGRVTGNLRAALDSDDINLVNISTAPASDSSVSYHFQTLSVPEYLIMDMSAKDRPLNTVCNNHTNIYGRNPDTIDGHGTAQRVKKLHRSVRNSNILEDVQYKPFKDLTAQ